MTRLQWALVVLACLVVARWALKQQPRPRSRNKKTVRFSDVVQVRYF